MAPQVLRLPRTDRPADRNILLHVSQSGRSPLDLKLVGTEHTQLFHKTLEESRVKDLLDDPQPSHFTGDLEEWKMLLKYVILHEQPKGCPSDLLQGVEAVAAIRGRKLTVTIRKKIGGITQRFASIELNEHTEREEVDGFDWADLAVANSDALRQQLETLQSSISLQKDDVAKLNQQLEDLVNAKKQHEDELLQKFAALLNEKKLKIRDQQRLLNGAKIDPTTAKEVRGSRDGRGRKPAKSRAGKRGPNGSANGHESIDDEDDEDEEDDAAAASPPHETPPASDHETEDEEGFDHAPVPATSAKRNSPSLPEENGPSSMDIDEPQKLPPRRELPFGRSTKQASKQPTPPPPANNDVEDDDETDDEL